MAAGEKAPVVGTNTLIATPLARPPWSAAADARVIVWNDHPTGSDPAVIAQVSDVGSLAAALGCGVAAVWVGHDVGPYSFNVPDKTPYNVSGTTYTFKEKQSADNTPVMIFEALDSFNNKITE
ncbi:MAG: hypothetical protein ACRCW4_10535, partial [Candidatus Neomicrothrix subdominans]